MVTRNNLLKALFFVVACLSVRLQSKFSIIPSSMPNNCVAVVTSGSTVFISENEIKALAQKEIKKKESLTSIVQGLVFKVKEKHAAIKAKFADMLVWHQKKGKFAKKIPKIFSNGRRFDLKHRSGAVVHAFFHDRQSDKLMVIAPGFNDLHYSYLPFLGMFQDYYILFINFRGSKIDSWKISNKVLCIDPKKSYLGLKEYEDIILATRYIKRLKMRKTMKPYNVTIANGMCFGAAMSVIAQYNDPSLFDLIIADSLWPNSIALTANFLQDLALVAKPQKKPGGFFYELGQWSWFRSLAATIIQNYVFCKPIPVIDTCKYLPKIKVPILMFYGVEDLLISIDDIKLVFDSIAHNEKVLYVTKSKHLLSFLKYQDFYAAAVKAFIDKHSVNITRKD